jgi:cystathionine gamma-synthase
LINHKDTPMNAETQAIHAGHQVDPATGAVTPPIYLSTTFERQADGSYPAGYIYSRDTNPNRSALEEALCALEGGARAAAFASGSAAALSLFQALTPADHIIAPTDLYYGVRQMLNQIFIPWGLQVSFVDMTNNAEVEQAVRPNTRLILIETPSNPLLKVSDIQALAEIAHSVGASLACDNTIATPILQRPLALGADLVIHATTKYLGGHGDIMGGIVIARQNSELFEKIKFIQRIGGAIPSPFECWLTLRGLQTLAYRVRAHAQNAQQVAAFLARHPAIEAVHYPGLDQHPAHAIAAKQMSMFGGLLSIQVKGGRAEAMAVAARVKLFTRATSFGGVHSLIEHRASIEAPGSTTPQNLLRLSIGLEHAGDLIEDLAQALEGA